MIVQRGAGFRAVMLSLAITFATSNLFAQATPSSPAGTKPPGQSAATINSDASPGPLLVRDQTRYILSTGDVLEVSVYGVPELTQKTRVGSNGDISLPLVNSVHVGGMSVEDAQARIEQALRNGNYLKNPHVTLLVSEYGSGVELLGEVVHPGIYPVLGSRRLLDILSAAGGTTSNAGRDVTIANRANHSQRTVLLSNDPQKAMEADVLVYQGETVFVPHAGVIYVVGEVLQPSGFVMENKTEYTALRAMAMAHGPTKFAKLSQARIIRRAGDSVIEILAPLDQIERAKTPDIKLQAEDILYVPTNKGKVAAARSIDVAISLATGLAIYGIPRN